MSSSHVEAPVATKPSIAHHHNGLGCLLQIYPLDISAKLIRLNTRMTCVGRDSRSEVVICDTSISRSHALIENAGDDYIVRDLGSTNGTYVNDVRVESATLSPGDRVQFGGFIFQFFSTDQIKMNYHEAVYQMVTRDGLTELLNRRSFDEHAERECQRATALSCTLSLILIDIDHFAQINETYGHLAGEDILRQVAKRINHVVSAYELVARIGGGTYAILIPSASRAEAVEVADQCRHLVSIDPFIINSDVIEVTVSCGVAEWDRCPDESAADHLMNACEAKLLEAKQSGRNRVC